MSSVGPITSNNARHYILCYKYDLCAKSRIFHLHEANTWKYNQVPLVANGHSRPLRIKPLKHVVVGHTIGMCQGKNVFSVWKSVVVSFWCNMAWLSCYVELIKDFNWNNISWSKNSIHIACIKQSGIDLGCCMLKELNVQNGYCDQE